jgi:nucleoside-diphosphate-sugar epimerase
MYIFVTGPNGWIGRALVQDLLKHGHTVLGLARNEATVDALTKVGVDYHRGDLEDPDSLKEACRKTDGIIHLGMVHDFTDYARMTSIDRNAIQAMGEAISGTGKPFVIASGTMITGNFGGVADEDTEADRGMGHFSSRALSADMVYKMSKEENIRGCVVRLPPTVHGKGDKGLIPMMSGLLQKSGVATYIGDGSARWPATHCNDAATCFRLAVEKGKPGATYNAVAEQGVAMKDIVSAIGKGMNLPVESRASEEAQKVLGFLAFIISMDNPTSSEKTRKELGWDIKEIGLLEDLEANYFC